MKNIYRAWVKINLPNIYHNTYHLKQLIPPDTKVMAVVKADGYGHGMVKVAETLDGLVDAYGVALVEEGVQLRESGVIKPILILGYTPKECYEDVIRNDLSQTVYRYEMAGDLARIAKKQGRLARFHVKVDTGMSRIGFPDDGCGIHEVLKIGKLEHCIIEGCYSHYAKADDADLSFSKEQWNRFASFIGALEEQGLHIPIRHICNSAGMIMLPDTKLNMVRCGISMYGLYPSDQVDKERVTLKPAMAVQARISHIKEVESGTPISYGGTFVTKKRTRVATIPVGYADGYPRSLSNKGRILCQGRSAPIIGTICMDQFMVDVSHIEGVKMEDTVTLLGRDGEEEITAEELADLAYSFHYEIVCNFTNRIPRIYISV